MDRHSEIEVKFDANLVTLDEYYTFLISGLSHIIPSNHKSILIKSYQLVEGQDTYYDINGAKLRYREGKEKHQAGELTYKQRKSDASIIDRVEINLPLSDKASHADVHKLIQHIGGKEVFIIHKTSHICSIDGLLETRDGSAGEYSAHVSLYDVANKSRATRRFLEVEIAASSGCSTEDGKLALNEWANIIKTHLNVVGPINQSIFELYGSPI